MANGDELRIALVMNGGVSLAVWIGGVSAEFGRLVAKGSRYGRLLSLLNWNPRIDVIAGSSAGGVNGAYLALALKRHEADDLVAKLTHDLRQVWISDGAINDLLRDPAEPATPSLLDGDGFYYGQLRDAFRAIGGTARTGDADVPIDLILTTTLLEGQPQDLSDDYGSRIPDITHRARFHFRPADADKGTADDLKHSLVADRLAVAARSTSSFPGAFEPSFCPISDGKATKPLDPGGRPFMDGIASFAESRFVVDGGVLDNKPLDVALDCIFGKRADAPARRVLAYVVPDPGTTSPPVAADPAEIPAMLPVVLASAVGIPSVQSVTNDIERLREHNERVRRKRQGRALITRHADPADIDRMSLVLFPSYRDMRLALARDDIVEGLNTGLVKAGFSALGRGGRKAWLAQTIFDLGKDIPWVPERPPVPAADSNAADATDTDGARERSGGDGWAWGTRTLVYQSRIALDLLVRLERCLGVNVTDPATQALWRRVFDFIHAADAIREEDGDYWTREPIVKEVKRRLDDGSVAALTHNDPSWLLTLLRAWRAKERPEAGRLATDIATFVADLAQLARVREREGALDATPSGAAEWKDLEGMIDYLVPQAPSPRAGRPVLDHLLALMVVDQTLGTEDEAREQEIEFILVSGNDDELSGRKRAATDKLNGTQLAHFGAFYKSSWRANDWLWGRRDAVPRILRILLDPVRLEHMAKAQFPKAPLQGLMTELRNIALDTDPGAPSNPAPDPHIVGIWTGAQEDIAAELAYIGDPNPVIPEMLPVLTGLLSRIFEIEILRDELPQLARQVRHDKEDRMTQSPQARDIADIWSDVAKGGASPAALADQMLAGTLLGGEKLREEAGTDPATFTVAKALAVAVTALRGGKNGPAVLGKAVGLLRIPSLIFYGIANSLRVGSRTTALLLGALVAAAIVVLASQFAGKASYSAVILVPAWSVLVAVAVIALFRVQKGQRGGWFVLPLVVALGVLVAYRYPAIDLGKPWIAATFIEGAALIVILAWNLFSVRRSMAIWWARRADRARSTTD